MTLNTSPIKNNSSRFSQAVRDEMRRNLPFFICLCVLCFVMLILPPMLSIFNDQNMLRQDMMATADSFTGAVDNLSEYRSVYRFGLSPFSALFFPAMAFLLGILQFVFLTNRRAMDVYASLPIQRGTAFWAKVCAALMILGVPTLVSYLILYLMNGSVYGFTLVLFWELLLDIGLSLLYLAAVYTLTVMVAALTGTILECVLYPPLLLVMPIAIYALACSRLSDYNGIYGFGYNSSPMIFSCLFPFLIPFLESTVIIEGIARDILYQQAMVRLEYQSEAQTFGSYLAQFWPAVVVWVLLAALFLGLGYLFYLRRPSELAGKRDGCRVLTWISVALGITVAGLFVIFLCQNLWARGSLFELLQYPLFFIVTIAGFFIFQVMIRRSVRESLRSMKGYLVVLPLYAVFFAALFTNGFGVYNRLPDISQVKSVSTTYSGFYYMYGAGNNGDFVSKDPETIKTMLEINRQIIDTRDDAQSGNRGLQVTYTLDNGRKVYRNYTDISDTADEALLQMNFQDDFIQHQNTVFHTNFNQYTTLYAGDRFGTQFEEITGQVDLEALQKAYQQDLLDETAEEFKTPSAPDLGMLQLVGLKPTASLYQSPIYLPVKACYKNTIQYLEQAGVSQLLQPDYTAIDKIFVADSYDDTDYIWSNQGGVFSLYDLPGTWCSGYYAGSQSDLEENSTVSFREVTDPEEIQEILEKSYPVYSLNQPHGLVMVPSPSYETIGDSYAAEQGDTVYWPFLLVQ